MDEQTDQPERTELRTEEELKQEVVASASATETPQALPEHVNHSMRNVFGMPRDEIRALLIKILLGCLIVAAGIAVVAVLIGSMTDIVWRAIGTVVAAVFHITLVLGIISIGSTPAATEKTQRSSDFLVNAALVITIMSFFTTFFHIWVVFDSTIAGKLYLSYIILLFSAIHAKVIMDVGDIQEKAKRYTYANLWLIGILAALFIGAILSDDMFLLLGSFYGRLIAAVAITDFTLSIAIAVMQHLHLQKHPELRDQVQTQHIVGRIIVLFLLFLFLGWPILNFVLAIFYWGH